MSHVPTTTAEAPTLADRITRILEEALERVDEEASPTGSRRV